MIWIIVAYAISGIFVFAVCMATGFGIAKNVYKGNYPESKREGVALLSLIMIFAIFAGALWPIIIFAFFAITTWDVIKNE